MNLLEPIRLNDSLELKNKIVMAPMTRCFADPALVPTKEMASYYAKRAAAGLIITEATIVSPLASGFPNTPGIYTGQQIEGWKQVTETVHHNGGTIFCQIWHLGRVAHSHYSGKQPIAPSAIALDAVVPRTKGKLHYETPRALSTSEVKDVIQEYVTAAKNSIEAGFDGVEIHGANGYLVDQFLHQETNQRIDEYGGSPENKARFALDIIDGIIHEIGSERLGIRLAPGAFYQLHHMAGDDLPFIYLLQELSTRQLAYVHTSTPDASAPYPYLQGTSNEFVRKHYKGTLIGCGDYSIQQAEDDINASNIDLAAFGRPFIANPDFVHKCERQQELIAYENEMLRQLI